MPWKPEYAEARKAKAKADPEYRAKINAQAARDPEAKKAYLREYYQKNKHRWKRRTPEQQAKYNAERRAKYAECSETRAKTRAKVKDWQTKNPAKRKAQRLRAYGIDPSDFLDLMAMQKGACAICGHKGSKDPKMFPVVDHCHKTGKVRGLLCMNCNQGLGKFKDDPNIVMTAAAYLARHG